MAGDIPFVERIASIGLPATSTDLIELDLDRGADHSLVAALAAERILGVAVRGMNYGVIVGYEELLAGIISSHDEVMRQTMRIEIAALDVCSRFEAAGIDHRLLKGAALAHAITENPADRSFRDVDVLIHGSDIDDAVALLLRAGATRAQPELRPGYDARFAKSVTLVLNGVEIDLHRVLSPGPFGVWMKPSELFLLKRTIEVGGRLLPTLDPTDHLIHACYHVALGQVTPVLANLRDVALLASGAAGPVDFDRFDETVARWKGAAVIKRAARLAQARLDTELPDRLVSYVHRSVPASQLDMIAPYLDDNPGGRFAALAPSTLKALPMSGRPAYALAVGLPEGSDPVGRMRDILRRR